MSPATGSDVIDDFIAERLLLFGIAYRMLGRVVEAEDMVQETWLRWQKQDRASIQSAKAWLTTTITRLCIDQRRAARRQREEYYGVWLPEPLVEAATTPPSGSEAIADSLTMAFMYMLETLSQDERAVFLLREVFEYAYCDIAAIIDTSETNCRQIFSRAKASLGRSAPARAVATSRAQQLVQQFLAACADGEVGNLLNLLAEDAVLYIDGGGRVKAAGRPILSADHISRFFIGIRARRPQGAEYRLARVNGLVGAVMYDMERLVQVFSFDFTSERVQRIYLVRNPDKLRHLSRRATLGACCGSSRPSRNIEAG